MNPLELVVFDKSIRDVFLIRLAASLEPYPINIRAALDGRRACRMLAPKRPRPDLVILEPNVKSGLSVLEHVHPYTPVVVFTSLSASPSKRAALNLQVADYIKKPTHPAEFVEAVSRIIRQWMAVGKCLAPGGRITEGI
jgi:DNA-binding response OmpR family regulator